MSKNDMPWLVPLCLCLALIALVTGVFVASVKNARALRRDLHERFNALQARLEKQANLLADELLARTKDTKELPLPAAPTPATSPERQTRGANPSS